MAYDDMTAKLEAAKLEAAKQAEADAAECKAQYEAAKQAAKEAAKHRYAQPQPIQDVPKKPVVAYIMWANANYGNLKKEFNLSTTVEVQKKAAKVWAAMSAKEKAPFLAKHDGEKEAYDEWLQTPDGKEMLENKRKQQLERKQENSSTPAAKSGRKRAAPDAESPDVQQAVGKCTPAKKGRRKPPVSEPSVPLAIQKQCEEMGTAENGVSYLVLLQKVLETKGLEAASPEATLVALKKHGGLVSKVRSELLDDA